MRYYFLKHDYNELKNQIQYITDKIRAIGQEMGASCEEGAETFHDNFAFEDGERQQQMWTRRLNELRRVQQDAEIIEPSHRTDCVIFGKKVTIYDEALDQEKTVIIGSYLNFSNSGSISYNSPLARLIIGAEAGEVRQGMIAGKKKTVEIVEIE